MSDAAARGPRPAGTDAEAPDGRRGRPGFFIAMLLLPVVFLGVVEGALRLVEFGDTLPMWVAADDAGEWLRMNPRVSERWFFGDVDAPGATHDPFRAHRRPETLRIVVQGGSSALGFPYFYGGAFPRMLEDRMRRAWPERDVEVVNTALTAVNSHTLRDIADEVVDIEPDAVLIYAGHNEFYGALGVASSLSGGSPLVIRAWLATRELRIVQAIAALRDAFVRRGDSGDPGGDGATTMARMVGEESIPLGSPLLAAGERQLRANLGDVLALYADAGIPVFVGTLVSNERDQPPLLDGVPDDGADWARLEGVVADARASGDPSGLAAAAVGLSTRDSTWARGFWELGRALEDLGDTATAATMYRAARDRDPLRFRAPTGFNDVLRDLADRYGATLVDVEGAFRAASPGGVVGGGLITEHLHPNLDGYHLLQAAFFDALVASGIAGAPSGPVGYPRSAIPATPVDSVYAAYLIESLTAGWPFQTDPAAESRRVDALLARDPESPEEALGKSLFLGEIGWTEAQNRLLARYESEARWDEALRPARALALEQALEYIPKARVGAVELHLGHREAALPWFRDAATLAPPTDPLPRAILRAAEGLDSLEAAVAAEPTAEARYALASTWALLNQPERAIALLESLLEDTPDDERATSLLVTLRAGPAGGRAPPGLRIPSR